MTMYGYARVSSKDQNLNRQLDALSAVGVSEESVFVDHLSGRNFDRPGYRSLVERLQPGDVLVVKSIDRLGRNYDEILGQWRLLTKQRSIDIVVLDMPLLDTRSTSGHGVTGKLIADIVRDCSATWRTLSATTSASARRRGSRRRVRAASSWDARRWPCPKSSMRCTACGKTAV